MCKLYIALKKEDDDLLYTYGDFLLMSETDKVKIWSWWDNE